MTTRTCLLREDEEKSFQYAKMYIDFINDKTPNKNIIHIDNLVQYKEIELHLKNKGIKKILGQKESIEWINSNADNFRQYINTLKLLAMILHCDHQECTYTNYIDKLKTMNDIKLTFIDSLF